MLPSNRRLLIVSLVAVVGVTGIGLFWVGSQTKRSQSHAEGHAIARTRMDIQSAFLAIQFYAINTGSLPQPLASPAGPDQDARSLYAMFSGADNNQEFGHLPTHWKKAQSLLDRWGNPLSFKLEPTGDAGLFSIQIWSNGPNGMDDGGNGDDISMEPFQIVVGSANP